MVKLFFFILAKENMAYFAKAKKEDLRPIASELGPTVADDAKLIDLKKAIFQDPNFNEELVRELINSTVEGTKEREQRERKAEENRRQAEEKG